MRCGNTGSIRLKNNGKWNFAGQEFFSLCGVAVPTEKVNQIESFVNNINQKYKIQGELKYAKARVKMNRLELIQEIISCLKTTRSELFIEIVDELFCVAMIITDYCVFPYYDTYNIRGRWYCKQIFANYICDNISNALLDKFARFFDANSKDKAELINLCLLLAGECNKNKQIVDNISETIDSVTNYSELGLREKNLFPLADKYNSGMSSIAVEPQINSLNNILLQAKQNDLQIENIVHDNITTISKAIEKNAKLIYQNTPITFFDSKNEPILQLTDVICGLVLSSVKKCVIDGESVEREFYDIINGNVNFVSTFSNQARLFPKNSYIKKKERIYKKLVQR